MQLVASTKGNVRMLKLPGDVTFRNAAEFHKALMVQAEDPGFTHVILDLRTVSFINSGAIGSLVALHNQVANRQGKLVLVRVNPDIRRLFATTRLDEKFWIRDDPDDALQELAAL